MESLLDQLAPHLGDADVSALREIIADIEQRIDRFGKGIS